MYITPEIKDQIIRQTDGGLAVFIRLFPDASKGIDGKTKFKLRDEKTPSAKLKLQKDGTWVLTDFGQDSKGKNCITWVMDEKRLDYNQACEWIIQEFQLTVDGQQAKPKVKMSSKPANNEETEGLMTFDKRKFTVDELKIMFAEPLLQWIAHDEANKNSAEIKDELKYKRAFDVLTKYGWSALNSYTRTKEGVTKTFESSPEYPIFIMEDGEFCKIYSPKAEKQFRFMYYPIGSFPKDHVWGIKQARKAQEQIIKKNQETAEEAAKNDEKVKTPSDKIESIVICSGERDSMNVALMGYFPVWQNSETKGISGTLVKKLRSIAENVYNLPDIDATGINMGIKTALSFPDLKTIWLPFELLKSKDWRGNPCKDLRDFLGWNGKRKKDFDGLVSTAKSCKFWYSYPQYDRQGNPRPGWEINDVDLQYFLWCQGFFMLANQATKTGYQLIRIQNHVVKKVEPKDIRSFVRDYLESHYADHKLLSKFMRSTVLNDSAIEFFRNLEIDFTAHTPHSQTLFFENEVWNVTANGIDKINITNATLQGRYVWEHKILRHLVNKLDPFFEKIENKEEETVEVEVINTQCLFFQYLIATCRIHWQKEEAYLDEHPDQAKEYWKRNKHSLDSEEIRQILSPEEISEQKQHLANKIFVFGYLLHEYKDQAKPWAAYCMDAKLSEEGKSNGRSGKSVYIKAIREILQTKTIAGRYTKITDNPHIYDGVDEFTSLIFVDDCHEYLKYDFFFTALTDTLTVNPKFVRELEIPFESSPKFGFTSNFPLKNADPSTKARLIFTVFSDFFHAEPDEENHYKSSRSIADWVGKNLFSSAYTEEDWNRFFNFCAQAIQFYLSFGMRKVNPPMAEVSLRMDRSEMGDVFFEWAEVFFSKDSGNLDSLVEQKQILEEFNKTNNLKWSTRKLKSALKAFCRYKNQTTGFMLLNPKEMQNTDGRIIKRNASDNKPSEFIYIQTNPQLNHSIKSFESMLEEQETNPGF